MSSFDRRESSSLSFRDVSDAEVGEPAGAAPRSPRDDASAINSLRTVIRAARMAQLESSLDERFVIGRFPIRVGEMSIGQIKYRHRGEPSRVAFVGTASRLAASSSSPSVVRAMVDVVELRDWRAVRVSGSDSFRRLAWLEASLRSVRTVGYDPVSGDLDLLRKERDARRNEHIGRDAAVRTSVSATAKLQDRGDGRNTALATLKAELATRKLSIEQRKAVMSAAAQSLARRAHAGEEIRLKIDDGSAAVHPSILAPARTASATRERAGPAR